MVCQKACPSLTAVVPPANPYFTTEHRTQVFFSAAQIILHLLPELLLDKVLSQGSWAAEILLIGSSWAFESLQAGGSRSNGDAELLLRGSRGNWSAESLLGRGSRFSWAAELLLEKSIRGQRSWVIARKRELSCRFTAGRGMKGEFSCWITAWRGCRLSWVAKSLLGETPAT